VYSGTFRLCYGKYLNAVFVYGDGRVYTFIIIKKYGKTKTFNIGIIGMLIGFTGQIFFGDTIMIQVIFSAVKGIGLGFASSVMMGMCADTVEYGEWKTGLRVEGMAFSAMTFASKVGNGLGSAIIGWLLVWGGFDADAATQSGTAILAIKSAYVYLPAILCAIMMVIMVFYDLDKRYNQIIKDLEDRAAKKRAEV
jgi:GPH family glycoside/pentoside/hexuronide:cation symporter